ncbi:MAG: T9SS type A sorting domain-containing protein [Bacteroidia bacterium]
MKKFYLLVLLNGLFINIYAQSFGWAKREGLWAYDYGYGIVNDNSGNVYVAGKYEEDADFSGTTLTCAGNHDIFLVRYSPTGTVDWIRTGGGSLGDYAHALSIDASGNLLVAGEIEGYGNLITFPGSSITLNSVGDNDVFLAKYNSSGDLLWAKSEGAYQSEKALGVASDPSGNIYICGYFTDTTRFNGVTYLSNGGHDVFLAKYDANGNFLWFKKAGGPGREEALNVKCDASGNVYVCGMHSANAVFDTQTLTAGSTSYPDLDIFLAKYDASGNLLWVKSPGSDYDDVAWSMVVDNTGQIFITGEYNAYAVFDSYALTTTGNADVFVASYDASGNVLWVKSAGGPLVDRARGLGTDGSNLYLTGQFGSTAMFGTNSVTAADSSDVFIASISNAGNFLWATSVGGAPDSVETLGYESGNAVTAESTGNVYATGAVLDGGTFGTTSFTKYGRTDVFVAKLTAAGVGIAETAGQSDFTIYPNPSPGKFSIALNGKKVNDLAIYDQLGREIYTQRELFSDETIDLSAFGKGLYTVRLISGDRVMRREIIVE